MAGINKEIWIDQLRTKEFFEKDKILKYTINHDKFVKNGRINLAFAGASSNVRKVTLADYPLPMSRRIDTPDFLELDNYATDARIVHDIETIELSYSKLDSCVKQDRDKLKSEITREGVWNVGPNADIANRTPIIRATGPVIGTSLGQNGEKSITKADIANLRTQLDFLYPNVPEDKWVLVLDSKAYWNLVNTDPSLAIQYQLNGRAGNMNIQAKEYYDFTIEKDSRVPVYNAGTLTKNAYGSVVVPGVDVPAAIAFVRNENVYSAMGGTSMHLTPSSSQLQGASYSFLTRAKVGVYGMETGQEQLLGAIIRGF